MYSEEDINSAVAAGAISAEAASGLRDHVSRMRELPHESEESFRLINSFNDIFVSIGIVILLIAVGAIGQALAGVIVPAESYVEFIERVPTAGETQWDAFHAANAVRDAVQAALAGLFVAATAWLLAEFFTRKRRMALPSIILLLAFVGGVFATALGGGLALIENGNDRLGAIAISLAALVAAGGAFVHWRRFMVPITVAAGTAAIAATVISLIIAAIDPDAIDENLTLGLVFIAGLTVFGFAMRWDISDLARTTRRSDVAFWLHLLAAPMIAHPVFAMLGVTEGDNIGIGAAVSVIAVYIVFGLIALAVDRRALLVSALVYVLVALTFLFREFGAVELNFALTALVIGSALLSLSAFWHPIRRAVVTALPQDLQAKLPDTDGVPALASGEKRAAA